MVTAKDLVCSWHTASSYRGTETLLKLAHQEKTGWMRAITWSVAELRPKAEPTSGET